MKNDSALKSKAYRDRKKLDPIWLEKERARKRDVARRWRINYPEKKKAENAARHKAKPWYGTAFGGLSRIIPKWADRAKIESIYREAYELGMEVDHIIPRNGKSVSGLHVENNLQILTREDNIKKGNEIATEAENV